MARTKYHNGDYVKVKGSKKLYRVVEYLNKSEDGAMLLLYDEKLGTIDYNDWEKHDVWYNSLIVNEPILESPENVCVQLSLF